MSEFALFALGVVLCALAFAFLEVQIEGAQGWAQALPTRTVKNRFIQALWGGRPVTYYHIGLWFLVLIIAHLPFLLGTGTFSMRSELRALAFAAYFWPVEDFLWFLINPAFGLRRFAAKEIWWHKHTWLWFAPRDYYIGLILGTVLYVASR
jgi:hypothetical protein